MTAFTWRNIPGWFDFYDLYAEVAATAKPGARFVEVGTLFGRSAAFMTLQLAEMDSIQFDVVDSFAWGGHYAAEFDRCERTNGSVWFGFDDQRALLNNPASFVRENLYRADPLGKMANVFHEGGAAYAARQPDESLDFIFIDAAHTYADTVELLRAFLPKVKRGGILAGHDHLPEFPGVVQAVREVLGQVEQRRSSFVWRKP
jgi:predicted O-methyltransferase YrrM